MKPITLLFLAVSLGASTSIDERARRDVASQMRPEVIPAKKRERCQTCGAALTDDGRCPLCQPKLKRKPQHCWSWFELAPGGELIAKHLCDQGRPD